jgi:hypothetical protein
VIYVAGGLAVPCDSTEKELFWPVAWLQTSRA